MSRFATLDDLKRRNEGNEGAPPNGSGNDLFVGGGDSSGLAVEGNDDKNTRKMMEAIMKKQSESHSGEGSDTKVITFWKNGFTIDDGMLRTGETDADKMFIEDINRGVIPRELEQQAANGVVNVDVQDKRGEEWVPPKYIPYSGEGRSLGASSAATASASASSSVNFEERLRTFSLDESQPTTRIQIRLENGKRSAIKFNLNHTVADVYAHAHQLNPDLSRFTLTAGFPPKPLKDLNATIEQAELKNAAVSQKSI